MPVSDLSGGTGGLLIFDTVNPARPTLVGKTGPDAAMDAAWDVAVKGNYAYVTASGDDALATVDISDPSNPVVLGNTGADNVNMGDPRGIEVRGDYAYVAVHGSDLLTIFDISNPSSPVLFSSAGDVGVACNDGDGDNDCLDGAEDVVLKGDYAYVAAGDANAIAVVDVSDPANPSYVGTSGSDATTDDMHALVVKGDYIYALTDNTNDDLATFDISSPTAPSKTSVVSNGEYENPTDLAVSGDYVYIISIGQDDLCVMDILTDPSTPVFVNCADGTSNNWRLNSPNEMVILGEYAYVTADKGIVVVDIGGSTGCNFPDGEVGEIHYSDDANVMMFCNGQGWAAMGAPRHEPQAVTFDGTADYLDSTTDVTVTDAKQATGSFWIRRNGGIGSAQQILRGTGNDFVLELLASNLLSINGDGVAADASLIDMENGTAIADSNWHHVLFSFDLTGSTHTATGHIYIDDASDKGTVAAFTDIDDIDFSTRTTIGATQTPSNYFDGDIADFWIDFGTYLDFSNAGVRRKFIDANGRPVNLGADGSRPTGNKPDIFLAGDASDFSTNRGTGGSFTENGALTDAGANPGAGGGGGGPASGLVSHWEMEDASGNIADSVGSNTGTANGNPTYSVTGQIGDAIDFDGAGDYFDAGSDTSLDDCPCTIAAWVHPDGGTLNEAFVRKGEAAIGPGWIFHWDSNFHDLFFEVHRATSRLRRSSSTVLPINTWGHVAVTWDGSTSASNIHIYINGTEVSL